MALAIFRGLTQKLDYLQDLGVTAIWLLPFYPSPLKDDGYDIADYYSINPIYGTLEDFKTFLREAHARGLRVITELVVNHTSDQHPWFQRSRRPSPEARREIFMSGATRQTNTRKPGSSLKTLSRPTGPGIQSRRPISGIGFIRISRT